MPETINHVLCLMLTPVSYTHLLHRIAVEKGLKEYDVDLDAGSRRYDLRVTVIK